MLEQMSQTLPLNSNNLQEWGHIHQRLNFPLMKLVVLQVRTSSDQIWDRLKKVLITMLEAHRIKL